MVNYNIVLQKTITIMLFIPEIGLVYHICVKNKKIENKKIENSDNESKKTVEKDDGKKKENKENIKITILEDGAEDGVEDRAEDGAEDRAEDGAEDGVEEQNCKITHKETD